MPNRSELIDDMIDQNPDWRGDTLARLREIVHDADSEIFEEVKWRRPSNPLGAAVFEHNGIVCLGIILKERVRLSFVAGSILPDPHKLFNAMLAGKTRAIDVYQGEELNESALKAVIRAGVEHNLAKMKPAHNK